MRVDQQAASVIICSLGVLLWTVFSLAPWTKHLHHACVLQLSRGLKSNGAHLVHPWSVGLCLFYFRRNPFLVYSAGWMSAQLWGWLENLLSNLIMDLNQALISCKSIPGHFSGNDSYEYGLLSVIAAWPDSSSLSFFFSQRILNKAYSYNLPLIILHYKLNQ